MIWVLYLLSTNEKGRIILYPQSKFEDIKYRIDDSEGIMIPIEIDWCECDTHLFPNKTMPHVVTIRITPSDRISYEWKIFSVDFDGVNLKRWTPDEKRKLKPGEVSRIWWPRKQKETLHIKLHKVEKQPDITEARNFISQNKLIEVEIETNRKK